MRKFLVLAALFLCALSGQAQEKVMNIQKADGTCTPTRLKDLKQISFLAIDAGDEGLIVKTSDGEVAAVLFEANPVVTISGGKLRVKPSSASAMEFEITDITEILFGDASDATPISELEGFACVVQEGGVLLRGIPNGVKPRIYSVDGRSLPTPHFQDGQLQLSRATLGTGIFIVKVGTFSTKIRL